LHSAESGILLHIAEVGYHVLAPSELNEFEKIIRGLVDSCKSSVLSDYPHGTTKKNFGKITLCSHKEKVGALYNLLLGLHHKDGREVWDGAQKRQQSKYKTFPSKKKIKESHESKTNGKSTKKRKQDARDAPDDERSADNDEEDDANDELPANAFLYRKDLMFGSDHREKVPFDRTDQSIEFICCELHRHGFGFLLDEDLDEHQLDLFMIASWAILRNIRGKPHQYPNNLTLEVLSQHDKTQEIFASIANEDGGTAMVPSYLEAFCKTHLSRSLPSRDINFTANNAMPRTL
jgi:hypothetical protein